MKHQKITEIIIGCAYTVFNKMGFGFFESVYEKCMCIELSTVVSSTVVSPQETLCLLGFRDV